MQVKTGTTDLLSSIKGSQVNSAEGQIGELVGGSTEFNELLGMVSGELENQDNVAELLNLINSADKEGVSKDTDLLAKFINNPKIQNTEKLSEKIELFSGQNSLKGDLAALDKFNNPELLKQLNLEGSEKLNLENIIDPKNKDIAKILSEKNDKVQNLKLVGNQSSSDFLNQLKTVKTDKIVEQEQIQNLKNKSFVNNYGKEQGLLDKNIISLKVDKFENDKEKLKLGEKSSSENILNLMDRLDTKSDVERVVAPRPVLDISSIDAKDKVELINKISNYIEQANLSKSENLDVLVKHDELGTFQITAQKNASKADMIDLKIHAMNDQGRLFFVENEGELLKSLNQNGIKVSDLKIGSGKDMIGFSDMKGQGFERSFQDSSSGQNQQGSRSFNQDFSGREDSQRRRNLWQQFDQYQQATA